MKCNKAKKMISMSIDGELGRADQEILDEHLGSCSKCQKDYEVFADIGSHVPRQIIPSPQFISRFWERVEAVNIKRKKFQARLVFAPVYVSVMLMLIIFSFSASIIHAYSANIKDKHLHQRVVSCYVADAIASPGFTLMSCVKFLNSAGECIKEACGGMCIDCCSGGNDE